MEDETTTPRDIPTPLTNIAISLSGGGFRATAFHLGSLSYLDHRKHKATTLLEQVSILSTISGGTLTGLMYALHLARGGAFTDCFSGLYKLLTENKLVDHALNKLNKPGLWKNKHKTRDLINAFAEVYHEEFFDQATFDTLYQGKQSHLSDAIFGASEFTYGKQFRFQSGEGQGRFGNHHIKINKQAAAEVRLADAAAASSCFPGGFEPMIMPTDFDNGPGSSVADAWFHRPDHKAPYPITAVMDGGVVDNQGIEGVTTAESRHHNRIKAPYIGTFLVSDVSARSMTPYEVPQLKYGGIKNLFSLQTINTLGAVMVVVILALLFFATLKTASIIFLTVLLTLLGLWFIGYFVINAMITAEIEKQFGAVRSQDIISQLQVLKKAPLYILIYLIRFRITSLLKMTSDIFMRRIRQLQIRHLHQSYEWNYRVKTNNIYALQDETDTLPASMKDIIDAANSMPTSLWFSQQDIEQNRLDKLIACGQFTLCHNLIRYIDRLQSKSRKKDVWGALSAEDQQHILELKTQLQKDWGQFTKDPFWLVEQYKQSVHIA